MSIKFNWRVVLVRPRNPLNIGAAARAMANFGFRDLVIVAAHPPVWQEARSAIGAEDVIRSARLEDDLRQALADATLVVGTTAGSRRNLDRSLISLADLPAWLQKLSNKSTRTRQRNSVQKAALLFGSEKTGLSVENLSYCHALVRIPTEAECPSMNLGQAVAVCCYELASMHVTSRRAVTPGPPGPRVHLSEPASIASIDHVFERAVRALDKVGYLQEKSRNATIVKLRRSLFDRGLTNNDVKILGSVLAQIEWKLKAIK
jgi:TrmH family RNA methyltransferase